MSNLNTNVLARSLRNRGNAPDTSSSSMSVVHIVKDIQHVTLPKIKSVNSPSWQKSACFGSLFNALSDLVAAHSVADVVSLVSNELPLDTTATFHEAQSASKTVLDPAINIDNLEPLVFLNSAGSAFSMTDFSDLEKRPADVTFVSFRCNMDGSAVNSCVGSAPDLSFLLLKASSLRV